MDCIRNPSAVRLSVQIIQCVSGNAMPPDFEIDDEIAIKSDALGNSKLFDVHRWSDHPEVDLFIDPLYAAHFAGRKKEIRKKHLKVLLLDLYISWADDPTRYIAIHRSPNAYLAGSRYNELNISRKTIDAVDALLAAGLLEQEIGWIDRARLIGRLSRIRPTEVLAKMFAAAKFQPLDISYGEGRSAIVLRDKDSKPVEYVDDDLTLGMAEMVGRYNTLLRHTFIDIPGLGAEHIEAAREGGHMGLRISQNDKFVSRIFNRGSFDFGGRFFGGWWQNCPKAWRKAIFFNDWPTTEIDFSGLHIVMLYALKGICYWDEDGQDPYNIDFAEFLGDDEEAARGAVKLLFLMSLNAESPASAFSAFRSKCEAGSPFKKLTNGQLGEVMQSISVSHPTIEEFLNADMGVKLMRKDSDIAALIIEHFVAKDIPILAIHDSYIVPCGHEDELKLVMHSAFESIMGVRLGGKQGDPEKEMAERIEDMEGFLLSNWQPYEGFEFAAEQAALIERRHPERSKRYNAQRKAFKEWHEEQYGEGELGKLGGLMMYS